MKELFAEYYYPNVEGKIYLAYGFRPIFLLLPIYLVCSIVLWALMWTGVLPMGWLEQPLHWHIFEMLYGMGSAALIGFLLTAVPELFLGIYPIVQKPLAYLILLWILGRLSFWSMAFTGIWLATFLNLALPIVLLVIVFKPIVMDDPERNHISLAFLLLLITLSELGFFLNKLEVIIDVDALKLLKAGIGFFMMLVLTALKRINTEAINFYLESKGIDEIYYPKPFRYNIAITAIMVFTVVEFLSFNNSALVWLGFAAMAGVLGILADYKLNNYFIFHYGYVLYFATILIMMASGYGFIAYSYLKGNFFVSHLRHFLTTGALSLAVLVTMTVITQIHTGRLLKAKPSITLSVLLLITATILRVLIGFYPWYATKFYIISSLLWAAAFLVYFISFRYMLLSPRADGLPG